MPRAVAKHRRILTKVPEVVLKELERRLTLGVGFETWNDLFTWLQAEMESNGLDPNDVKLSQLQAYAEPFRHSVEQVRIAMAQARIIEQEFPDDDGRQIDGIIRVAQSKLQDVLLRFDAASIEATSLREFISVCNAVQRLSQTAVTQNRYKQEVKQRAESAAKVVGAVSRSAGLSKETIALFEEQILGIRGSDRDV